MGPSAYRIQVLDSGMGLGPQGQQSLEGNTEATSHWLRRDVAPPPAPPPLGYVAKTAPCLHVGRPLQNAGLGLVTGKVSSDWESFYSETAGGDGG